MAECTTSTAVGRPRWPWTPRLFSRQAPRTDCGCPSTYGWWLTPRFFHVLRAVGLSSCRKVRERKRNHNNPDPSRTGGIIKRRKCSLFVGLIMAVYGSQLPRPGKTGRDFNCGRGRFRRRGRFVAFLLAGVGLDS